jgi:hypothetical protein
MKKRTFQLSGGDSGAYGSPFGPVNAVEIEVSNNKKYLVVQLEEPIEEDEMEIQYFIVAPRYVGDTLETLKEKGCTVGVSIVLPDRIEDVLKRGMSCENSKFWAIGECKRIYA